MPCHSIICCLSARMTVGHQVMRAAAGHLVPLPLELGGKSPVVVARGHVNSRTLDSNRVRQAVQPWPDLRGA